MADPSLDRGGPGSFFVMGRLRDEPLVEAWAPEEVSPALTGVHWREEYRRSVALAAMHHQVIDKGIPPSNPDPGSEFRPHDRQRIADQISQEGPSNHDRRIPPYLSVRRSYSRGRNRSRGSRGRGYPLAGWEEEMNWAPRDPSLLLVDTSGQRGGFDLCFWRGEFSSSGEVSFVRLWSRCPGAKGTKAEYLVGKAGGGIRRGTSKNGSSPGKKKPSQAELSMGRKFSPSRAMMWQLRSITQPSTTTQGPNNSRSNQTPAPTSPTTEATLTKRDFTPEAFQKTGVEPPV